MITKRFWQSVDRAGLPLWLALAIGLLALGGEPLREALAFDRQAIAAGQWWRLLSAHVVHLNAVHLGLNVAGLAVLALLCPTRTGFTIAVRRVLLLGLGTGLCLYHFAPSLSRYVGLSGVLHGLFVLGLAPGVRAGDRYAQAAMLMLIGKLCAEALWGAPPGEATLIGGRVVTAAHGYGALSALAYGGVFGSFKGREADIIAAHHQTSTG